MGEMEVRWEWWPQWGGTWNAVSCCGSALDGKIKLSPHQLLLYSNVSHSTETTKLLKTWRGSFIDNRPCTKKNEKREKEKIAHDIWHLTWDIWHVTRDMWHVTLQTWHMTSWGRWTFSQNISSLAFTVCEWRCSDLTNDEGVCITAPAIPGLVITNY